MLTLIFGDPGEASLPVVEDNIQGNKPNVQNVTLPECCESELSYNIADDSTFMQQLNTWKSAINKVLAEG